MEVMMSININCRLFETMNILNEGEEEDKINLAICACARAIEL